MSRQSPSPFAVREFEPEYRRAVLEVIDRYVTTVNERDGEGNRATMVCPHVRLANDAVLFIAEREGLEALSGFDRLAAGGWHRTELDWAEVIQGDANKAHVALQYSRYDANDQRLITFESLYVLVRQNEVWAIQARSSFAPR
ncbi:MAG: hypothetical protein ABIQ73_07030 [Acidimicrobiales bacterium]